MTLRDGGENDPTVDVVLTRKRIHDAASELFAAHGYQATGIRAIALAAGTSTSNLYHYVGTKEDLLVEIMREGMQFLTQKTKCVLANESSPEGRIVGLVYAHIMSELENVPSSVIQDDEIRSLSRANRTAILRLRDEYEDLWKDAIDIGMKKSVFEHPEPHLARLALLGMCTYVARWYVQGGESTPEEICQFFADFSLKLLCTSSAYDAAISEHLVERCIERSRGLFEKGISV